MKPEEKARQNIDKLLTQAGWIVQDLNQLNLGQSLGVCGTLFSFCLRKYRDRNIFS